MDDPYIQGKIAACNVLSDMYAMGVTEVDTMLMILGVSVDMEPDAMDYVTKEMIRGFNGFSFFCCVDFFQTRRVWPSQTSRADRRFATRGR